MILSEAYNTVTEAGLRGHADVGQRMPSNAAASNSPQYREFQSLMYRFIDESDLLLMARVGAPAVVENQYTDDGFITSEFLNSLPTTVIMPAFVLSELRRAFEMGFMIYLPFVVIDLVVSAILVSMGMLMLPPVIVSLPFKVLVFVLVDGWGLVVEQLMVSTMVTAAG